MHLVRIGVMIAGALVGALVALWQRWGATRGCVDLLHPQAASACAETPAAMWTWVLSAAVGAGLGWLLASGVRRRDDGNG